MRIEIFLLLIIISLISANAVDCGNGGSLTRALSLGSGPNEENCRDRDDRLCNLDCRLFNKKCNIKYKFFSFDYNPTKKVENLLYKKACVLRNNYRFGTKTAQSGRYKVFKHYLKKYWNYTPFPENSMENFVGGYERVHFKSNEYQMLVFKYFFFALYNTKTLCKAQSKKKYQHNLRFILDRFIESRNVSDVYRSPFAILSKDIVKARGSSSFDELKTQSMAYVYQKNQFKKHFPNDFDKLMKILNEVKEDFIKDSFDDDDYCQCHDIKRALNSVDFNGYRETKELGPYLDRVKKFEEYCKACPEADVKRSAQYEIQFKNKKISTIDEEPSKPTKPTKPTKGSKPTKPTKGSKSTKTKGKITSKVPSGGRNGKPAKFDPKKAPKTTKTTKTTKDTKSKGKDALKPKIKEAPKLEKKFSTQLERPTTQKPKKVKDDKPTKVIDEAPKSITKKTKETKQKKVKAPKATKPKAKKEKRVRKTKRAKKQKKAKKVKKTKSAEGITIVINNNNKGRRNSGCGCQRSLPPPPPPFMMNFPNQFGSNNLPASNQFSNNQGSVQNNQVQVASNNQGQSAQNNQAQTSSNDAQPAPQGEQNNAQPAGEQNNEQNNAQAPQEGQSEGSSNPIDQLKQAALGKGKELLNNLKDKALAKGKAIVDNLKGKAIAKGKQILGNLKGKAIAKGKKLLGGVLKRF